MVEEVVTEIETPKRRGRQPVTRENVDERFNVLISRLSKSDQRELEKLRKDEAKLKKVKTVKPKRPEKPTVISETMASFLGVKKGELVSREDVLRRVWAYIREKKDELKVGSGSYKANTKLSQLFGIKRGDLFKPTDVPRFFKQQNVYPK